MSAGNPLPPDPNAVAAAMPQQPAPDVGQGTPAPPSLAPQPAQRTGARGAPLLGQLLADLIKPSNVQSMQAPGPGQIATMRPVSRAQDFEGFLGQFLYSMGQGFANEGRGPGAAYRGAGAAITAPYQQQIQQQQLQQQMQENQARVAQQQAQTQQTQQQTQQAGQMVTLPNGVTLPMPLARVVAPQLFQAQGREEAAAITGQAGIQRALIQQGMLVDVPQELQDQFGAPKQLPLAQLNKLESAANRPLTVVQGAAGPSIVNKQTNQTRNLGLGAPALAKPVQVADPDNPGGTKFMPAGEAMRQGAAGATSASVTVPKSVLKDFTSGKSAQTLNAFNTATDHLQILSNLGDALNNGSIPLINQFANRVQTFTGGAAPTTFDMARIAVAGEVAKTFKGNATNAEIEGIESTINKAQSPAQLKGAINTALTLMNSKRQALMEQYDQGIKGAPAFPSAKKPSGKALDPLGIR